MTGQYYRGLAAAALVAAACGALVAATDIIESPTLAVTIDRAFPRIVSYRLKPTGPSLDGQLSTLDRIGINGRVMRCHVSYIRSSSAMAQYAIDVPEAQVGMTAVIGVQSNTVLFRITQINERSSVKVMTISIPEHSLVSLCSTQADATLVVSTAGGREHIMPLASYERGPEKYRAGYVFVSGGGVAAGIACNALNQQARLCYQVFDAHGAVMCRAWCPEWTYRAVESETVEMPWARVFVTGDRNGDGKADWQDAAILFREGVRSPFGCEHVPRTVVSQIGMNFASLAQEPFLRILDNVKKTYLYTDGLGQEVLLKGYQSEGHDSAHPDYGTNVNVRAGGKHDLDILLARMKKWNARGGVHINATEAYPEAIYYATNIVTREPGWCWLDQSYLIDKKADAASGSLFSRLDQMREALPALDFVYVDVYNDTEWPAFKIASKLNRLGFPLYTEFGQVFDHDSVWSHQRSLDNRVIRFMWNGCRDVWSSDPLLRGANHFGFMGWSNERDVVGTINATFAYNLPTKYLQHFALQSWSKDAAVFDSGVRSEMKGNESVVSRNGRVIARNANLFIPWDPIKEEKIYIWTDSGAVTIWDLPPSWTNLSSVWLYKLTDVGRVWQTNLPVSNGTVTVKVPARSPHVLYPAAAPSLPAMDWGEGGPLKDPGFDSHGFECWSVESGTMPARHVCIANDVNGDASLVIAGADGAEATVKQAAGVKPGKTYSASAWMQITGQRSAGIAVALLPGGKAFSNVLDRTDTVCYDECEAKHGTRFRRVRIVFDTPARCSNVVISLFASRGAAGSTAEFDNVRLVETVRPKEARKHYYFEDFEHVDQGWCPFVLACRTELHTHLSELHEGFTKDTINGRFSLKTWMEPAGLILRTLPSELLLAPRTTYSFRFEYLSDAAGMYSAVVKDSSADNAKELAKAAIGKGRGTCSGQFATGDSSESYIGIVKLKRGEEMLVIDDFAVDVER